MSEILAAGRPLAQVRWEGASQLSPPGTARLLTHTMCGEKNLLGFPHVRGMDASENWGSWGCQFLIPKNKLHPFREILPPSRLFHFYESLTIFLSLCLSLLFTELMASLSLKTEVNRKKENYKVLIFCQRFSGRSLFNKHKSLAVASNECSQSMISTKTHISWIFLSFYPPTPAPSLDWGERGKSYMERQ